MEQPFADSTPPPPARRRLCSLLRVCTWLSVRRERKYLGGGSAALSPPQFSDSGATVAVNMTQELPVVQSSDSEVRCAEGPKVTGQ